MTFIAGILTVLLVLTCLLLIFLVLIQLPKKDAGAGLAFGGGAADALFGAGSGNALTKITKYAIIALFVFCLALAYLEESLHRTNVSDFERAMQQTPVTAPAAPVSSPATAPAVPTPSEAPAAAPTPAPAAIGTNAPAK